MMKLIKHFEHVAVNIKTVCALTLGQAMDIFIQVN